jgi:hypothetical protein
MAKSKRRREKRRRRPQRPPARPDQRSELERELTAELDRLQARAAEAHDPRTPPERIATILIEDFEEVPVPPGFARSLATQGTAERAHAVLGELEGRAGRTAAALTFAAEVAWTVDGDPKRARRLLEQALEVGFEPGGSVEMAQHLADGGMAMDALDVIVEPLADDPADPAAQQAYAAALGVLHAAAAAGKRLSASEREALARFEDRSDIYALRSALRELVESRPELESFVEAVLGEWLAILAAAFDGQDLPDSDDAERDEALGRMAIELAWILDDHEPGAGVLDEEGGERDGISILELLAADPATSPVLAGAALAWNETVTFGLWQLADPEPRPGVWLTEIVTGSRRYVAVAAEQLEQAPRWTVWLGALVALDGTWRTTGVLIPLRPSEADEAAQLVREAIDDFARWAGGKRTRGRRARRGRVDPAGVLSEFLEPPPADVCAVTSMIVTNLAPTIAGETWSRRLAGPQLTNMEGHRTKLITADVELGRAEVATERLLEHPDFRAGDDDGEITWWGRELTAQERSQMCAQVQAQFGEDALDEGDDEPQRWLRGRLRVRDAGIDVEVNSEERLTALLDALTDLQLAPTMRTRTAIDPHQDLPQIAAGTAVGFGSSQAAVDAWSEHWPDDPVPALGGLIPRVAATRRDKRPLLEAVLREFEHDADVAIRQGRPAPDIAHPRAALGMTVW